MSNYVRIYLVTNHKTDEKTLVEASNQASALRMVVERQFDISVPSAREVASMIEGGYRVVRGDEPAPAPALAVAA